MKLGLIERDQRQTDFSTVRVRERLNELRRLVRYRHNNILAIGMPGAWAWVVSDLALAKRGLQATLDADQVESGDYPDIFIEGTVIREQVKRDIIGLFWRIGLGPMVEEIDDSPLIWPRDDRRSTEILPASIVAAVLEVTSVERAECQLRTIDAVDEDDIDRRRRANREREKARRQAAGVAPQALSKSRLEPWREAGVSRATWYRMLKQKD